MKRKQFYRKLALEQRRWLDEHGGTLSAYITRYGSKNDPEHFGDGGEAIFNADYNALLEYERLSS